MVLGGGLFLMSEVPLYDGFGASNSGGSRDQIYTTYGLKVDSVWEVDFW